MASERRVVISGLGVVSPFGIGKPAFLDGISAGTSAAALVSSFDASRLPTRFAASIPLDDSEINACVPNQKALKTMSRSARFGAIAANEAVENSGIDLESVDPYRTGTSIGVGAQGVWDVEVANRQTGVIHDELLREETLDHGRMWSAVLDRMHPLTALKALPNIGTAHVAIAHNARGNCNTFSTACTSSAQAIGEAYRIIQSGHADVVIAGGTDSMVNPMALVAFSGLGVLSRNNDEFESASRPFDKRRDGFMIGEGSAMFVVETFDHCRKRKGRVYAEILGYAATNDAWRLTDEPEDARGSVAAMKMALADARIAPETVDYINAHGTGTQMNDATETYAIKTVFGESVRRIPVSSTKSMVGHLVAAAGAIECAACMLAMEHSFIPPTINYQVPDPVCDLDYVPNESRNAHLATVVSNSFGFGGQNACLVFRKV